MRISWLAPDLVAAARTALQRRADSWDAHFTAGADGDAFAAPPAPPGVDPASWPSAVEHVARAERVVAVVVADGYDAAHRRFGAAQVAVEAATLASAAHDLDALGLAQVEGVLACAIDEHLFYAPFLRILVELAGREPARMIGGYEHFARRYAAVGPTVSPAAWRERVAAVDDGLAGALALVGRHADAHAVFTRRHAEDTGDAAVALSASRTFLAAGELGRSVAWLELARARAETLRRGDLARVLGEKLVALRRRMT